MGQQNSDYMEGSEISLGFLWRIFRNCWYWVLLFAVIAASAAGVYTLVTADDIYSSTCKFYVTSQSGISSTYNPNTNQELASTHSTLLENSQAFFLAVAKDMAAAKDEAGNPVFPSWVSYVEGQEAAGAAASWSRVRGYMSTGTVDGKELVYVTMTSTDAKEAYYLASYAERAAKTVLEDLIPNAVVKSTYPATMATSPAANPITKNVVLAGGVGAVLAYLVCFLIRFFDTTVRGEEDVKMFELPILGRIPTIPDDTADGKHFYQKKQADPKSSDRRAE